MAHLTNYERETIISFNEAERTANIYTHNGALLRKLEKLAQERPEECKLEKVSRFGQAADYTIPKAWVHIYPTRILSEAERAQRREASKGTRFAKKNGGARQEQDPNKSAEGKLHIPAPEI